MALIDRIKDKTAKIGVIGLGYVGLPLAVEKAKAGFSVLGFDVQQDKCDKINRGENYIGDIVPEELEDFVSKGLIKATTNFDGLKDCDVVAICVPTPLDKFKQPDLSYVEASTKEVAKRLHKDMLVVLESTTYPGTTEEILKPLLEASALKVGTDIYLAFSPERVDPGNATYKTHNTPKVVGGCTAQCTEIAKTLYESVLDAPVFVVSSPKEAEATKILENTFRIVNCALANEMAILCHKMGINVWDVIKAASTKPFGFVPFYPGPGIGGHCIPLDPFYLTYKAREYDYHTRLIELAGEINDSMPDHVVERLMDLLNDRSKPLRGSRVLLLGVAYKGDIDDLRESPSLKVWKQLERKGAVVSYHDPYCPEVDWKGEKVSSVDITEKSLKEYDAVVITTAHKHKVDYKLVADNSSLVFDTKNVLAPALKVDPSELENAYLL
ncbi:MULTISPECIES: nucleotide sugar dehydrogenase [Dethiosulfovibrio]|uniref:Nucleotide sugar dehydrogenase n=2 Tax=Dethiosulfovibrio TaxID=47054 RepID=A0ABS9ENW1_9BACT|nr:MULTISPECIES: nucleotide sugar dehydrogenase [Dethiosulfovibrio]MCF4113147.1 nucleotide sugar dehydrogenase [Dethiosulfovibrio russensis]MCF4142211.1 nucleotide sugar dehydrogenase [Dethiosulfovibrio marinus]MCF4144519.1 nucleotide sugar dehydrogenase [Dethiosulfovibrio acidaminovorans]